MKAGRNDPCPCGSGKKYKKCCLAKDLEPTTKPTVVIPPIPEWPTAVALPEEAPTPAPPLDPITERGNRLWGEFESRDEEGRIAVFLETLEDAEVMTDDMAFEMLNILRADAIKSGDRARVAEWVGALRERRPDVFAEGGHYYLSWGLQDALADSRQEDVHSLARELAARAGRDIDIFNRAIETLAYHGHLPVLVDALRVAWPLVKSSDHVVPWGISEFAEKGVSHEIFDYLEHTTNPDPTDPALLDRIQFFIEEPREKYLREFLGDLTGTTGREWQSKDFALKPSRKTRDPGETNLSRLIAEFVGYLRRVEGVPYPRGELVRPELLDYFLRRHDGSLDPRPSMLDQAMHPERKPPKPAKPAHPLCPERVTLDVHLAGMMSMMNGLFHSAAALFQAMPAWLRFLESRRLIDAATREKVMAELLPLHATLLRIWEQEDDPLLYRQGQAWLDQGTGRESVPDVS